MFTSSDKNVMVSFSTTQQQHGENDMNKEKLITNMLDLLHAANCAGCEDTEYAELSGEYNSQTHLFGHLSDALKLIAPDIYAAYIDTGNPDYACSVATARKFPNDHWLYVEAAEKKAGE